MSPGAAHRAAYSSRSSPTDQAVVASGAGNASGRRARFKTAGAGGVRLGAFCVAEGLVSFSDGPNRGGIPHPHGVRAVQTAVMAPQQLWQRSSSYDSTLQVFLRQAIHQRFWRKRVGRRRLAHPRRRGQKSSGSRGWIRRDCRDGQGAWSEERWVRVAVTDEMDERAGVRLVLVVGRIEHSVSGF